MARPLHDFHGDRSSAVQIASKRRLDRSTAQALAAAVAALAVATVVVGESTAALDAEGTASANEFASGSIALVDDDGGRSLVVLEDMAPGRPVERCITITYAGTVLPADLAVVAETDGDIAPFVQTRVERGSAAGFGSCSGFVAATTVFDGTLDGLAAEPIAAGSIRSESEDVSFRFTFDLVDDEAAEGRSGAVDFIWEAVPG